MDWGDVHGITSLDFPFFNILREQIGDGRTDGEASAPAGGALSLRARVRDAGRSGTPGHRPGRHEDAVAAHLRAHPRTDAQGRHLPLHVPRRRLRRLAALPAVHRPLEVRFTEFFFLLPNPLFVSSCFSPKLSEFYCSSSFPVQL